VLLVAGEGRGEYQRNCTGKGNQFQTGARGTIRNQLLQTAVRIAKQGKLCGYQTWQY
jgi:hypothetical protein